MMVNNEGGDRDEKKSGGEVVRRLAASDRRRRRLLCRGEWSSASSVVVGGGISMSCNSLEGRPNREKVDNEWSNFLHSGLNYGGVQGLLGLANTTGTIEHALPPPRSALLSSFMLPYKIGVKSSTLTHGARALAKLAHRSRNKYWGTLDGTDSEKNRAALDVITHLITNCSWINLHIVPPHGDVFEIRVADGYGARWSKEGNKFVGFLEPYAADGHSMGWMH